MNKLPIIKDATLSVPCCPKPAGIKELDKVIRTLPVEIRSSAEEDMLQDEAGFPVNDEVTDGFIFDDLKTF